MQLLVFPLHHTGGKCALEFSSCCSAPARHADATPRAFWFLIDILCLHCRVASNPWGGGVGYIPYDGVTVDSGTLPGSWYGGYNLGMNAVHETGASNWSTRHGIINDHARSSFTYCSAHCALAGTSAAHSKRRLQVAGVAPCDWGIYSCMSAVDCAAAGHWMGLSHPFLGGCSEVCFAFLPLPFGYFRAAALQLLGTLCGRPCINLARHVASAFPALLTRSLH